MIVADVMAALEEIAPARYAFDFDRIGLQVGDPSAPVSKIALSLDPALGAIDFTNSRGCEMLISHHPVIWNPLKAVSFDGEVAAMIRHGITFAAAHTNWDCAPGGVNDALINALGLTPSGSFGSAAAVPTFKMTVFTPPDYVYLVLDAASAAGAGKIGEYSRCGFFHEGTGTFISGEKSKPTVGTRGETMYVPEARLEMVVPAALRGAVERAIREVHPYEEPAMDFIVLAEEYPAPAGRLGTLEIPMSIGAFSDYVGERLGVSCLAWGSGMVQTVGVVGGAASGEWSAARAAGADVFVTGEVRHSDVAFMGDFRVVQAGHYATEQPGVVELAARLAARGFATEVFSPAPGSWGRPGA